MSAFEAQQMALVEMQLDHAVRSLTVAQNLNTAAHELTATALKTIDNAHNTIRHMTTAYGIIMHSSDIQTPPSTVCLSVCMPEACQFVGTEMLSGCPIQTEICMVTKYEWSHGATPTTLQGWCIPHSEMDQKCASKHGISVVMFGKTYDMDYCLAHGARETKLWEADVTAL